MDIVQSFKKYLLEQKNKPNPVTVKNYVSDIRKFVNWFFQHTHTQFTGKELTLDLVSEYQSEIKSRERDFLPAASSAKRYISSLRKFNTFLQEAGLTEKNLFLTNKNIQRVSDPFFFKEFSNFLYTEHASKLTIKNYMADIKQFIDWLKKVSAATDDSSTLLQLIDNYALEQYKDRLLLGAKLSTVSINRKLSSLRRYLSWLSDKDILRYTVVKSEVELVKPKVEENHPTIIPELPLTVLQGISEKSEPEKVTYSGFAPFRLAQKTTKAINLSIDLLFFNPLTHVIESIQYSIWKNGKRKIFTPVGTMLKSSSYIPSGVSIKTIIPKASSTIPPRSANLNSVLAKIREYRIQSNPETVHNFSKALYAPLKLSTINMNWKEKLFYHLRYTRPKWYKIYLRTIVLFILVSQLGIIPNLYQDKKSQQLTML